MAKGMPMQINSTRDIIQILNYNKGEFEDVLSVLSNVSKKERDAKEVERCEVTIQAIVRAMELCEKDILRLPNTKTCRCPNCNERVPSVSQVNEIFYCQNCGQKLTWNRIKVK